MFAIDIRTFEKIKRWADGGTESVLVVVVGVEGSAPRDRNACMAVTDDTIAGTIGGGQLEWLAMDHARKLLAAGETVAEEEIPLGPEIGQCCGGRVKLRYARIDGAQMEALRRSAETTSEQRPDVLIFGAGHTGKALAQALALLPLHIFLIDSRPEELENFSDAGPAEIQTRALAMPEQAVAEARPGSAFVTMTHEHSLDFLITAEALKRDDAAYCGMIGSATKRAVFLNWLRDNSYGRETGDRLVCPIGGEKVRDKRPEVIAALTAAEIMTAFHPASSEVIS